ncbi:MAG: hypothetical protein ACP5P3_07575 [Ignavibacteria bacterium]
MKTNLSVTGTFLFILLVGVFSLSCGKLKEVTKEVSSSEPRVYFCERWDAVKNAPVNESTRFTPGYLTVVLEMPGDKTLGVAEVNLRITKTKDASGTAVEKIIGTFPFEVEATWNTAYFSDPENITFSEPGTYRVSVYKNDGTLLGSGELEVVSK